MASTAETEEETFSRGAVVRIKLRNFLTYDEVTVNPGPRLNLLIGPNGSGKSTVVAALVLGLAGSPQILGRAPQLSLYVKEGTQEGFIELELFDPNGNQVISRTIRGNHSTWALNGEKVKEERVKRVVADLNIQVDNLCQILPQERVQDFVKMNAQALLEGTEKAVGYAGMHEDHVFLKDKDSTKELLTRQVAEHRSKLGEVEENIETLQVSVDNDMKRKKFERTAARLRDRREWLKYELARTETARLRKVKEDAETELNEAKRALEPRRQRLALCEKEEKSFQLKLDTCNAQLRDERKAMEVQNKQAKKYEVEIENFIQKQEERETREQERQQREAGLRQKLETVLRDLANAEDPGPALEAEIRDCNAAVKQLSAGVGRCQDEQEAANREYSELQGRVNGLKEGLRRVQSVTDQKLELLQRRNRDAYNAVLWLRQNRDKFAHPIHEPMILLLDVDDVRMAKYVQAAVPWTDLLAFTCETRADMNLFLQELREHQRLRVSCVLSDPAVSLDSLRPQRTQEQLRQLGFQGTVGDLFRAPDAVRRYLYKTHKLHNIPVADVDGEAATRVLRATQGQQGLNSYMIGDLKYRSGQSQYGSRLPWTSTEPLARPDQLFTLTADTARERELCGLIEEAQRRQEELGGVREAAQARLTELNGRLEQARRAIRELTARRDNRRMLEGRRNTTEQSLRECERASCDLAAEARQTASKIGGCLDQLANVQKQLLAACRACQALELRGEVVRAQLDLSKRRTSEARRDLSEASESLQQLQENVREAVDAFDAQKRESKRLRVAALKQMKLEDDNKLDEALRRRFNGLPTTLAELETNLQEAEARADMLSTDDGAVRRYHQLKESQSNLLTALKQRENELERLETNVQERRTRWLNDLNEIVTEVNKYFGQFLREMGCAGEVALFVPENGRAAEYGISIKVKYRASEQLCELSATHHSGGERSVATMLYVMALQHLKRTSVPFHCVDEINQGMDARNERRVFELVVRAACRSGGAQYFLVTPKLLPKLQYPEHGLTVLCVFSPVVGKSEECDIQKYIQRKRRAVAAAAAAAARGLH
ncbi:Structural maintenance of chromosomes protein 5 [Amphibalanus amphitrite]|uniref:Structural maintenance of chromosomes protein 5 n=1 Tax=Amphibalanus amphitrite TaxID=1232801 RepID=A0A6A4VPT2_AMPAM|nr:Structural maintenance of chromosomes protein 5 [Amphibalanus amphitrite]